MNAAAAATRAGTVERLDRAAVQRYLPQLDAWLLPTSFYGVQHTWPQLYRSDGGGAFFVLLDGAELQSHCAWRAATVHGPAGPMRCALLGSVATAPERRGRGFASDVLRAALAAADDEGIGHVLLWAERPGLYARHGFAAGAAEVALRIARRPRPDLDGVRLATVQDHAALHALHEQNPLRVERTPVVTSGLLTTPGMQVFVRERQGRVVAAAATGKGADLAGHWHELLGPDDEIATLLAAGLHLAEQTDAVVLVPPYRTGLATALGAAVVEQLTVPGPMVRSRAPFAGAWIDGLDSV